MKTVTALSLLLTLFFGLSSCNDGEEIIGTWEMESMVENIDNGDEPGIFQCQVMRGDKPTDGAMNVTTYTKYSYSLKEDGKGTASTKDTDGNYMNNTPIKWSLIDNGKVLSITTNVFIEDTREYKVESLKDGILKLTLDYTFPEAMGGQNVTGSYTLKKK